MELGTSEKMIDSNKRVKSTTALKSLLFRQFVVAIGGSGLFWPWKLGLRFGPCRDVSKWVHISVA